MSYNLFENFSLKKYNTFSVEAKAKIFIEFGNFNDLFSYLKTTKEKNILIIGSGSNILFTGDFNGIVIHPVNKGIKITEENSEFVEIKASAGEIWDDFVKFTIEMNFWGLENLSYIPGTVGATPVQNIGAYGVEIKNFIAYTIAYDILKFEKKMFTNAECKFGYRDSIFKNIYKNKYIIEEVVYRLSKSPKPVLTYGVLAKELNNVENIDQNIIRQKIIEIRKNKLPEPSEKGNAGSFFKNPYIDIKKAEELKKNYDDLQYYQECEKVKIPAAWLIEKCGWKGKNVGNVGVYDKQALILINNGAATGKEIFDLSEEIKKSVFNKFGIWLEREVQVI